MAESKMAASRRFCDGSMFIKLQVKQIQAFMKSEHFCYKSPGLVTMHGGKCEHDSCSTGVLENAKSIASEQPSQNCVKLCELISLTISALLVISFPR